MSLEKKFESSFSWQSINVVSQIALQLGFIAIMTRLLSKEDFGVLAIALVVVGFIEIFSQIGIGPALIQRKDLNNLQINGAFHVSIILGISFFVMLYVCSGWVGRIFEHEALKPILQVVGLSFIISAISIVPKSLIIKKMQFKKLFVASMFAMTIGNFGVGVTLAYMDYGVWAYVYALLAQNVIMSVFYWIQNPVLITRKWYFKDVRDMIRYGVGSTLFNIWNYGASKIDVIIVGLYGGHLNALSEVDSNRWSKTGIYDRSVYLNSLPITVLGKLSDSVMFSGLSMIQDQQEKLKRAYLVGTYFVSMLIFPATAFLIFFAKEIVISFYSLKYEAAIPIVKILFISVALRSLIKLSDAVVRALDAVYMASAIKFVFFLLVGIGAYYGLEYGLEGVAMAIVISVFIQYFLMTFLSIKLIGISFSTVLKKMIPGIIIAILVGIISLPIYLLNNLIEAKAFLGLCLALVGNLVFLLILAWKVPWLFGKGKDNIIIFVCEKTTQLEVSPSFKRQIALESLMKKILFTLILLLGFLRFFGQGTILSVQSADSIPFFLYVNDQKVQDTMSLSFSLEMTALRNVQLTAKLGDDSIKVAEHKVNLQSDHINSYYLMKVGTKFIFTVSNVTTNNIVQQDIPKLTENTKSNQITEMSEISDAQLEVDIMDEPEDKGCAAPYATVDFERLMYKITEQNFQSKRVITIRQALDSGCFTVKQLSRLIETIEFEDMRMDLIKQSYSSAYDRGQFGTLSSLLFFEKNIKELNLFISNQS